MPVGFTKVGWFYRCRLVLPMPAILTDANSFYMFLLFLSGKFWATISTFDGGF